MVVPGYFFHGRRLLARHGCLHVVFYANELRRHLLVFLQLREMLSINLSVTRASRLVAISLGKRLLKPVIYKWSPSRGRSAWRDNKRIRHGRGLGLACALTFVIRNQLVVLRLNCSALIVQKWSPGCDKRKIR